MKYHNTAPIKGFETGTIPVIPSPLAYALTDADVPCHLSPSKVCHDFDMLADITAALALEPQTDKEKQLSRALALAKNGMVAAAAREVITADWARLIEAAAAKRKDGKKRQIRLGGRVATSDECFKAVEEKEMKKVAAAAKKGTRKKRTTKKNTTQSKQPTPESSDSESFVDALHALDEAEDEDDETNLHSDEDRGNAEAVATPPTPARPHPTETVTGH